jgi:hypothetical protein
MKNELVIFNPENTMEREMYTTVDLNTEEARVDLFNATESADVLLNDIVGQTIIINNIYIEKNPIKEVNDETGEVTFEGVKYRTILFDVDGQTYATGSYGIYNSVRKMIDLLGVNIINKGIKVEVIKVPTKDGKNKLSLKLVK